MILSVKEDWIHWRVQFKLVCVRYAVNQVLVNNLAKACAFVAEYIVMRSHCTCLLHSVLFRQSRCYTLRQLHMCSKGFST